MNVQKDVYQGVLSSGTSSGLAGMYQPRMTLCRKPALTRRCRVAPGRSLERIAMRPCAHATSVCKLSKQASRSSSTRWPQSEFTPRRPNMAYAAKQTPASIPPKTLESRRAELRVPDGVLNVPMPEPQLQCPRIVTVIGQLEAAGMPEHVGMHRESNLGLYTGARDHLAHAIGAHRSTAFGYEHEAAMVGPFAGKLPECPQLVALHRMGRGRAILGPPDVQEACLEVDLVPLQGHQLGDPQTMPVAQQDQTGIALPVP